jgi:DNA repair exonuclease SbcCD nuclease subunit
MKILCVGDIHIKPSNTHLVDALQTQIIQASQKYAVESIVLLGDILDTFERVHTQALNRAYQLIDALRQHAQVYVLVGNHDLINNQQFLTDQHWMNGMKQWDRVHVVDSVYAVEDVMFVPYVPVRRFRIALETHPDTDWRNMRYIFAHQEFEGAKMGAIISSEGERWDPEWPMVISGHIHERQTPQPNLYYIGASIQNSFGDRSTPVLALIADEQTGQGTAEIITEIPLHLPRKKTVYTDLERVQTLIQSPVGKGDNDQIDQIDQIRIVIKSDYEQFKLFLKTKSYQDLVALHPNCKVVHAVPTMEVSSNSSEPTAEPETGEFDEILVDKVLHTKDEYLYSTYMEVIHETHLEPGDILIV